MYALEYNGKIFYLNVIHIAFIRVAKTTTRWMTELLFAGGHKAEFFFDTQEEAQQLADNLYRWNNSSLNIVQLYGEDY